MHKEVITPLTLPKAKALPELHEAVLAEVERTVPRRSCILDIAAGNGALTERLLNLDYAVIANDIDASGWALPGVSLEQVDLNTAFDGHFIGRDIRAIAAVEIIEHLENPRWFLRACRAIVPDGGHLLVTTPNVTSAFSRAMFLRLGTMPFFHPAEYHSSGHLTMLPHWLLAEHAKATGWSILRVTFAGQNDPLSLMQRISTACASLIGRFSQAAESRFGCSLFVLEKRKS